ncbi:MAG TPA: serine/threonine-protein kinase, partial [Candidatus Dormibacteraeota bacterium]
MGRVWRGAVRSTGEAVAVKVLNPELAADPEVVARFLQERGILIGLDHPHLVGVHDLVAEGDTLAIVMDLVQGSDLRRYLGENGPLAPAFAAGLMAQVLTGLAAVHSAGIVHRDLKPENILLEVSDDRPPVARLSDFGIARLTTGPGLTRTTGLIGTPEYMAPEMAEQVDAGPPADIYAAGIVLHELLTGRTPFAGGAAVAILRRHVDEPPARPEGLPDALWQLLSEMLAKRPDQRPGAAVAAERLVAQVPALLAFAPAAGGSDAGADPNATRLPGHHLGRRPGDALDTGRMAVPMPLAGTGPQRATAAAGDQQLTMLPGRARVPIAFGGATPAAPKGTQRTAMLLAGGVIAVLLASLVTVGLLHRSSPKPAGVAQATASAAPTPAPEPSLPADGRVNNGALDTDFNRPGEQNGGFELTSDNPPDTAATKVYVGPAGDHYLKVVARGPVVAIFRKSANAVLAPSHPVNIGVRMRTEGTSGVRCEVIAGSYPKVSTKRTLDFNSKTVSVTPAWTVVTSTPIVPVPGDTFLYLGITCRSDTTNPVIVIGQVQYTFTSGPTLR